MRTVHGWAAGIVVGLASVGLVRQGVAQQDSTKGDTVPASLESRIDALDQQVRILQRLRELAADSAAAAAKDKVSATASAKDGFSIKSADGKFAVRLKGLVQTDARIFLSDKAAPATTTFFLRRARPILEATVGKYLEFRLQPDFGQGQTVLFDAYSDVKIAPAFAIRVGKFKPAVDLERYQSASDIVFAERALATNLAPNRDIGLQLSGDISTGAFTWQAGIYNGVPDLGNGDGDVSDAKDVAGRVFLQPFKLGALAGLGFGVAGTTGLERGTILAPALASYRTPGQQTWFKYRSSLTTPANNIFADGRRSRVAPQAYFYSGPLGLHGEYIQSWQAVTKLAGTPLKLKHTAWQTTGSIFLTGEKNSFKSAAPKKPFDPKAGTFGALELAARYSELSIDDATFPTFANPANTPSKAKAWAIGLNWYLAKAIKVVADYEHTTFTGGTATGDREDENFVATRVQYSF
ncbi:MAG TPA: porin [Gemmatimonadales bacterium]|jgi:phosphate-selective porin OprO/OprP|nr:porin [Gemmatimonadales bacterium]